MAGLIAVRESKTMARIDKRKWTLRNLLSVPLSVDGFFGLACRVVAGNKCFPWTLHVRLRQGYGGHFRSKSESGGEGS
jgi:hypothetical protein